MSSLWPWLTADGWDEAKHPRVPAGSAGGGEFEGPGVAAPLGGAGDHTALPPVTDPVARGEVVTKLCLKAAKDGHDTQTIYDKRPNQEGLYQPQRLAMHNEVVNRLLDEAVAHGATADREAIILGGLPGIGKSSSVGNIADKSRYVECNPDNMKEELARAGLVPAPLGMGAMEASCLSHEEASDMAKQLSTAAQARGLNVLWDVSMGKQESVDDRLTELDRNGYHTTGIFIDGPVSQALAQSQGRYARQLATDPNMARPVPAQNILGQKDPSGQFDSINRRVFDDTLSHFGGSVLIDNKDQAHQVVRTTGDPLGPDGKLKLPSGRGALVGAGPPLVTRGHFERAYRAQLARRDELEVGLQAHLAKVFATQGAVVHRRLLAIRRQLAQTTVPLTASSFRVPTGAQLPVTMTGGSQLLNDMSDAMTAAIRHPVQPANPTVTHPVMRLRAEEVFMDGFDETLADELDDPLSADASEIGAALVGLGLFGTALALNAAARAHVDQTIGALSTTGRTALSEVQAVLADTYSAGDDYDTMVAGVDGVFQNLAGSRAALMARQAVTGLLSGMGTIAARLAGLPTERRWNTQGDDRVRGVNPKDEFDHVEADGQIVGLDEPFIVSGEPLDYPGDPSGSLGNVVNCRCFVTMVQNEEDSADLGEGDLADAEGDIPPDDLAASAQTETFYRDDQPRDDHGRWTGGEGGSAPAGEPFVEKVGMPRPGSHEDELTKHANEIMRRNWNERHARNEKNAIQGHRTGEKPPGEPFLSKVGVERPGSAAERLAEHARTIRDRNRQEQQNAKEQRAIEGHRVGHVEDFPGLHAAADLWPWLTVRRTFAGNAGNAQALIDWYDKGADGQIPWGEKGAFYKCVEIAGDHVDDPEAFCSEREHDATGHWPGEKKEA